ncbi:unnamed protein product [Parascedosporium putredinis]|uniref:Uncharacterized protein n=1 Tax=Parascedosporium putredinis TaxID=1442378 RepID=A0A9P1M911_9PEZI|nr:unnamed protein product [Parascedosporium putredinis]CAI7991000.1 unnamed protein product [Parascedosporium putredinis]
MLAELKRLLEVWEASVPESFRPWSEFQPQNDTFPTINYVSPWHAVAWQYYYAAKVLVELYQKPEDMSIIEITRYMESYRSVAAYALSHSQVNTQEYQSTEPI